MVIKIDRCQATLSKVQQVKWTASTTVANVEELFLLQGFILAMLERIRCLILSKTDKIEGCISVKFSGVLF
jgi:hypothetical protein